MSSQDSNPLIAFIHICHAKVSFDFMRLFLTDIEIEKKLKIKPNQYKSTLDELEQKILSKIAFNSPSLPPKNLFAVNWL